mmetsp:Transcript_6314/g.12405  ORF Transcript_6314/g.12405 Transcript_6314/m.12405 type:complete len:311 (+) Transcript_6314:124-1056(+)
MVVLQGGLVHQDKHLLILGLGYSGVGVANYFSQKQGWKVTGTTRRDIDAFHASQLPLHDAVDIMSCVDFGGQMGKLKPGSPPMVTHILSTIPPPNVDSECSVDPVIQSIKESMDTNDLSRVQWMGYLSTTRLYGDHQGAPVWEDSELRDTASQHRYRAEQEWLENFSQTHVFRCGGIYGPYRSVIESLVQSGGSTARLRPSQRARRRRSKVARCHVYDICNVIEKSIMYPHPGSVFNIVDDDPAPRWQVEAYAASLLDYHVPPQETDMEPPDKIVMNERIKKELHVDLVFPSYREGLDAIVAGDMRPFYV